ncbi:MAG: dihydrolipoyl dehydrogenase [Deltaproteobacteria bacterium]|nr:MAG: dihydrolipoyl dehydrogenase [Deltaproteobacteria bacterium]
MVVGSLRQETEVVIIGGGPGGYIAALRVADLGKEVTLIDDREQLGGVCLLEGCIPSKTLINAVEVIETARNAEKFGLTFSDLKTDLQALREWTDSVVSGLAKGVHRLLQRRGVELIRGRARFESDRAVIVEGADLGAVEFRHCIIATGSRIQELPLTKDLPVWTSREALRLPEIPETLLIIGGGYIGLELGQVYTGLGSRVTMVELLPKLLMGADPDLVEVLLKHCTQRFESILLESKVVDIEQTSAGFAVTIEQNGDSVKSEFSQVLVAVGRRPNTDDLGLPNTKITPDRHGFIRVSPEGRTAVGHIYAIGDVTPGPMLAHKASREGKVVAEVIAQHHSAFDNRAIPAVVYTDPEISWSGLTQREAETQGIEVNIGRFPLKALGRARTLGRSDGLVKIISDPKSGLILGVGMVGPLAGELIAEGTLAVEMGATLEDLLVTIHPHPTLSEAIMEAAEVAAGSPVHVEPRGKNHNHNR